MALLVQVKGVTGRPRRLSATAAFILEISLLIFFLAGSSAPTPLYSYYQAEWGFSSITLTVVFAIYALAVLSALLTVGSLSDHIGRRPVLLVAIGFQAVAMLVFATATGVPELVVARVIQGLATGAALGALGAGLLDIDRERGTVANGVAPLVGTASGALGASLLVQYVGAPSHLVYLLLFGIFLVQGVGVAAMPETATPKPGAWASLRPQIGMPVRARRTFLLVMPALIAVWALAGFYLSLGPALVGLVANSHSVTLGGLAVFALAFSAGLTVLITRNVAPGHVMRFGTAALVVGVGLTLVALDAAMVALFFLGTIVAGVGFGSGFQGALRSVLPLAALHERAGMLSTIYVVCYVAMGLPAVAAGVAVVHLGVLPTARWYAAVVMVLAALVLFGQLWPRRSRENPDPALTEAATDQSSSVLVGQSK